MAGVYRKAANPKNLYLGPVVSASPPSPAVKPKVKRRSQERESDMRHTPGQGGQYRQGQEPAQKEKACIRRAKVKKGLAYAARYDGLF